MAPSYMNLRLFLDPFNTSLPDCPHNLTSVIAFPSVSFVYMFLGFISLCFGSWTAFRYNSVPVNQTKERKGNTRTETVRKNSVSNTLWILYFMSLCLRATFDAVRFALVRETEIVMDETLSLFSLSLFGLSVLLLTLALEHQRKYRSFLPDQKKSRNEQINSDSLKGDNPEKDRLIKRTNKVFILLRIPLILFLFYLAAIFVAFFVDQRETFYLFLSFYILQRVPLIILLAVIVLYSSWEPKKGPSKVNRVVLTVGILLNLVNEIPLTMWSFLIIKPGTGTDPCIVGGVASAVDIIHIFFLLSQILLFVFLRKEFFRNSKHCVWKIISKRDEGYFHWREFEDEENNETREADVRQAEYDSLFNNAKNSNW